MNKNKKLCGCAALACFLVVTPVLANSTTDLLTQPNVALEIVKANGQSQLLFLVSDGSYTTTRGAKGTWTITGDEFCVTRNQASNFDGRGGAKTCGTVLDDKSVGFSWIVPFNSNGDTKYTIVNANRS